MRELDVHVADGGWDQPTRLFAIADTEALLAREPQLSVELSATHSLWTTIEQQEIPPHDDLDDLLGGIRWPAAVEGVALSAERITVNEESAGDLPADPVAARRTVAEPGVLTATPFRPCGTCDSTSLQCDCGARNIVASSRAGPFIFCTMPPM